MQTLDFVSGLYNRLEFSQPALVFASGYVNTEKVFYYLNISGKLLTSLNKIKDSEERL